MLAVGLSSGGIVLLDLINKIEKNFHPENHPGFLTQLAFWEDKVLVSGCSQGKIILTDIEFLHKEDAVIGLNHKLEKD